MEMSRFLCEVGFFFFARVQFVTLPRCPDVYQITQLNVKFYGNSVRFLAKIPSGTVAESPCYSVFWNAIDFCRLYTSKKISTVPLFAGKSRFFMRNVHQKTFSRLAGLNLLNFWYLSRILKMMVQMHLACYTGGIFLYDIRIHKYD